MGGCSWSSDDILRVWDGKTGACLVVLTGHGNGVRGALELSDGRLLSWSWDQTLRLWDSQSGMCLAVLKGHAGSVDGALELPDARLVSCSIDSWSADKTFRLWDGQSGACLEVISESQVANRHPAWLHARTKAQDPGKVFLDFFVESTALSANLRHKIIASTLAGWHASSDLRALCLLPDGTLAVTQENLEVCILKLHHGNRHVSLAEAEELLRSEGRISQQG